MAVDNLYSYLSTVTPDYSTTTLNIAPQNSVEIYYDKTQVVMYTDANTTLVININSTPRFRVVLNWEKLNPSDSGTIMNFWCDTAKANGSVNTFKWYYHGDAHTYVVRFLTQPKVVKYASGHESITSVELLLEGNSGS